MKFYNLQQPYTGTTNENHMIKSNHMRKSVA